MKAVRRLSLPCVLVLPTVLLFAACGGAGAPTSVPTPVITPTPDPTPDPNVPPAGSGCGQPYPPRITRMNAKVHLKSRGSWFLDSTPLVGPDGDYCAKVGYTDGRLFCTLRVEGDPERAACEIWRVGVAKDTGRPGPTWTLIPKGGVETYCSGDEAGCRHTDSPFNVEAIKGGLYKVCTADDVCAQVDVDRNL